MEDRLKAYERRAETVRKRLAESHTETSLDAKESGTVHGTWQFENLLLSYIRDGELEKLKALLEKTASHMDFNIGTLAYDPLRQAKNLLIGLVALVGKVSGIGGGMDIEDAYRLIDLYTQECEKAKSVEEVYLLQYNMVIDFTERVRQAKLPENLSRPVFDALQYIADHSTAAVSLDEIAAFVGVSRSALTRSFKAEMGKTISQYITEVKLRDAKRFLRYSDLTLGEIASYLSFSSQSYFQTVFKKETGLTPGEYRRRHGVTERSREAAGGL